MIAILSLFILSVGLLGLAIGFGVIVVPWFVSLIIAAPAIFIYMLMIGSVLWLVEVNFFLGMAALVVYAYWIHIIRKHLKSKGLISQ
ncbi:TPA: hypothetical protein ACPP6V_000983 [Haemophilus influenzae]